MIDTSSTPIIGEPIVKVLDILLRGDDLREDVKVGLFRIIGNSKHGYGSIKPEMPMPLEGGRREAKWQAKSARKLGEN